jgi:hypothetical protein
LSKVSLSALGVADLLFEQGLLTCELQDMETWYLSRARMPCLPAHEQGELIVAPTV